MMNKYDFLYVFRIKRQNSLKTRIKPDKSPILRLIIKDI